MELTLEKLLGKARSRPIAKETRVDENVVALSALIVESKPPTIIRNVPKGINCAAARAELGLNFRRQSAFIHSLNGWVCCNRCCNKLATKSKRFGSILPGQAIW